MTACACGKKQRIVDVFSDTYGRLFGEVVWESGERWTICERCNVQLSTAEKTAGPIEEPRRDVRKAVRSTQKRSHTRRE